MDIMASLCGYQEGINELKSKLMHTSIQLESEKLNAEVEIAKHNECINQLVQLLKAAYKERDEARECLQKLLKSSHPSPSADRTEVYGYSFFNSGSSELPDSSTGNPSNFEAAEQKTGTDSSEMITIDLDYKILKEMVKDKPLPQKGQLLEAVLEARPLLQTLLAAGSPLPRWKNPPPMLPVVGIKDRKEIEFDCKFSIQSEASPSLNGKDCESCQLMLSNANCGYAFGLNSMCCSCDDLSWDFHAPSYSDGN
ncbi:hypothetical protein Ancab_034324 [Ancistrocladus abbreviatus]